MNPFLWKQLKFLHQQWAIELHFIVSFDIPITTAAAKVMKLAFVVLSCDGDCQTGCLLWLLSLLNSYVSSTCIWFSNRFSKLSINFVLKRWKTVSSAFDFTFTKIVVNQFFPVLLQIYSRAIANNRERFVRPSALRTRTNTFVQPAIERHWSNWKIFCLFCLPWP